jgi:hypothetical protein
MSTNRQLISIDHNPRNVALAKKGIFIFAFNRLINFIAFALSRQSDPYNSPQPHNPQKPRNSEHGEEGN